METLFGILSFGYIFFAIATASTMRFWVMRRNYVWASSILAALILVSGYSMSSRHLIMLGLFTFFCKSLLIPLIMKSLLSSKDATPKIISRLKPTLMRQSALFIIVATGAALIFIPGGHFLNDHLPTSIIAFASIGIAVLSLGNAKSTYGQLFGVLMIENAFSLLILALGIEFHIFIEIGLLTIALMAWFIMHMVSDRISMVFGGETIAQLNELSE
jgi:hydrogenase-4 membrane subunit HyfE